MKYSYKIILLLLLATFAWGCNGNAVPATPVETLKAYTIAVKKKDTKMMKMLLSEASMKIHEEQAKAQSVAVDEIIQRETLFSESQRVFDYKNEKIEGDRATVEVKNDFESWDMVHFVKEGGIWKIDKKGFSDQIIDQNEDADRKLDDEINQDRQEAENSEDANSNSNSENANANTNIDPVRDPDPITNQTDPSASPVATPDDAGDPSKSVGQ